jgi:rare lipoprotein A (peptidoglycan hydrolase)
LPAAKIIDQSAARRDVAAMTKEKLDQFEVQREITLMLDSFEEKVSREIMAGLAERYGLKLVAKTTGSGSSYRPSARRKVKPY